MKLVAIGVFAMTVSSFALTKQSAVVLEAERYCQSIQLKFQTIADGYGLGYTEVIPIIYPELLRYSTFSDAVETTALEYLYVQQGSEGADFSIGRFQMKPSFIVQLEQEINALPLEDETLNQFSYTVKGENAIRSERIGRLSKPDWQMHYLCLFYCVMNERFSHKKWSTKHEKLAFYASAYNYGFTKPANEINAWSRQYKFLIPATNELASYAELAVNFQTKISQYEN